jgi:peptide deformylase
MISIPKKPHLLHYGISMAGVESDPVDPTEYESLGELRTYMLGVMQENRGIGLSACQVGVFKQFFIMENKEGDVLDFVNPEIERMYGAEREGFESCLSIPPFSNGCLVFRMQHVILTAGTVKYPKFRQTWRFSTIDARVVQHEVDHLWGTFFIDRVSSKRRNEVLDSFNSWKRKQIKQGEIQCKKPFLITAPSSSFHLPAAGARAQ